MNLLLGLLDLHVPTPLKRRKLAELFECTAAGFQREHPPLGGLAYAEMLREYGIFTKREAERAISCGENLDSLKGRLHWNSFQLGSKLRQSVHIRSMTEVMTMGKVLYRVLGIDFRGNPEGMVEIGPCYFSGFYSGEVCRVMSSVDEGAFAGLSGGGRLIFSQRITEGSACCRATLNSCEGLLCGLH